MAFKIVVLDGQQKGKEIYLLDGAKICVGRDQSCDLQLLDTGISQNHLHLWNYKGTIWAEDAKSTNGTFINKYLLSEKEPLKKGDLIEIGTSKLQLQTITTYKDAIVYQKVREDPTFAMELPDPIIMGRNLLLLHKIGKLVQYEHNVHHLLGTLLEIVLPGFNARRGCVFLSQVDKISPPLYIYRTQETNAFKNTSFLLNLSILNNVVAKSIGILGKNTSPDISNQLVACVPLERGKGHFGAIYIDSFSPHQKFNEQDLDLLTAISRQAGLALERLYLEKCLIASEKHYRSIHQSTIEHSWDVIYRRALDNSFLLISPAVEKLLGYSAQKFIEAPQLWEQHVYSHDKNIYLKREIKEKNILKYRMTTVDKKIIWVEETCYPVYGEKGEIDCIQGIVKNITTTKLLEKQLKRKEHLAILGEFSAGVAHEIRNPLSAMEGFAELLKRKSNCAETKLLTNKLVSEIHSLNGIVGQILAYARDVPYQCEATPIFSFLKEVFSLALSSELANSVEIDLQLAPDIPTLFIDAREMKRSLVNIVQNSVEAMRNSPKKVLTIQTYKSDCQTIIAIIDTGEGISSEKLEKVFTPFFTTRENGTGLGLAIASKIIEGHQAQLKVESTLAKGTKMTIIFNDIES